MGNFKIETDLSFEGTKFYKDGEEITANENVIGMSFYASSPMKDRDGYTWGGFVEIEVTSIDDNKNIERKSYRTTNMRSEAKKFLGKEMEDFIKNNDITLSDSFIGKKKDVGDKSALCKTIYDYCKTNNKSCPSIEDLEKRTLDSLKDKAKDLNII